MLEGIVSWYLYRYGKKEQPDAFETIKLTAEQWDEILDSRIADPDGWRADGKSWDEPISLSEFVYRASASTRMFGDDCILDKIRKARK